MEQKPNLYVLPKLGYREAKNRFYNPFQFILGEGTIPEEFELPSYNMDFLQKTVKFRVQ